MNIINCETERLIVRFLEKTDYNAFVKGYKNSLPSRNRFDEGCFDTSFMTFAWFDNLMERRSREAEADYCYMFNIFRKEDGLSIGYCDITPHRREEFQYARIGYTIHNQFWNKGYATECVGALIRIGFDILNLHRLEAHINLDNPASKRVAQKAGLCFECIRKAFIYEDGQWTDNEVYFINNENWKLPYAAEK